jgi:hypothetical protein
VSLKMSESLWERVERLKEYIDSPRFALTLDDVVHDYQSGNHRYALKGLSTNARRRRVRL